MDYCQYRQIYCCVKQFSPHFSLLYQGDFAGHSLIVGTGADQVDARGVILGVPFDLMRGRFEPDEYNFVKERSKSGTTEAFKTRDAHFGRDR